MEQKRSDGSDIMKCLICGGDSAGEVCNKCSRLEKILYQKEWSYKEGMIIKKTEEFRIAVSNMRISGRVAISDNPKGLNARLDNMTHYLLNVQDCTQTTYQGKKTVMVAIESSSGDSAKYKRFCFLPGFDEADQFIAAIAEGKQKASTLTDRIRQTNGLSSSTPAASTAAPASFASVSAVNASAQQAASTPAAAPAPAPTPVAAAPTPTPVAPAPAPEPTPVAATPTSAPTAEATNNYDTVALSSIASDINEFETKIKKLKVLRDNGILSEEEYLAEKKKLVSIF